MKGGSLGVYNSLEQAKFRCHQHLVGSPRHNLSEADATALIEETDWCVEVGCCTSAETSFAHEEAELVDDDDEHGQGKGKKGKSKGKDKGKSKGKGKQGQEPRARSAPYARAPDAPPSFMDRLANAAEGAIAIHVHSPNMSRKNILLDQLTRAELALRASSRMASFCVQAYNEEAENINRVILGSRFKMESSLSQVLVAVILRSGPNMVLE